MRAYDVTVVGVLVIMTLLTKILTKNLSIRGRAKIYILLIYTTGILIWPVLWKMFLQERTKDKLSIPGLLWPIMILMMETYLLKYHTFEQHTQKNKSMLSIDANAICSLTFALSSILGAQNDNCCKHIFIYGVLGCVAFVMPTPQMPSETIESVIIEHIQKVILTYSTALLLLGSMLLMHNSNKNIVEE
jgi:hypothetical protein